MRYLLWCVVVTFLIVCVFAAGIALADRAAVCVSSAFIETGHPIVVNPTSCE